MAARYLPSLAMGLLFLSMASAALTENVWAVFVYTIHGDTIPMALPYSRALSAYGASGLYEAGSSFRDRYVAVNSGGSSASTRIKNLSPYALQLDEVDILTTADQATVASAQAFMQGLYPPLGESYNATYVDPSTMLANGSLSNAPLNGYQYPQIFAPSLADPQSIQVAGQAACTMHQAAESEYRASSEFQRLTEESKALYLELYDLALSGVFDRSSATYANAYAISEYLDYQVVHNETLFHNLNEENVVRARWYADQYIYATNGNKLSSTAIGNSKVRTVAGRTLAYRILDTFNINIYSQGASEKLSLVFGSYEPVVALASLLQLESPERGNFQSRPTLGGSIVFELISLGDDAHPTYPDPSELYVRFVFHNGTDPTTNFKTYALFGHGPSVIDIPYSEFYAELKKVALSSPEEWCRQCNSQAVFCSGFLASEDHKYSSGGKKQMSPAVGGVIGAVVTLAVVAVVAIAGLLICGYCKSRGHKSSMGGFKGSSKMASDSDVTFKNPIWGDVKAAEGQAPADNEIGGTFVTNERSGSWELRQQAAQQTNGAHVLPSSFQDEIEEEWRTNSALEPVKTYYLLSSNVIIEEELEAACVTDLGGEARLPNRDACGWSLPTQHVPPLSTFYDYSLPYQLNIPQLNPSTQLSYFVIACVSNIGMMRYEIPTLLALSQKAHIDIEKFSIQALGNNLLRQRKTSTGALSERLPNRSRQVSSFSCQTNDTCSTSGAQLKYPSRQPNDPPQGVRAQTDTGFARFLKEHTSPKHQRVTAGGRIVPMDSAIPAPKFKLPTNKQVTLGKDDVKSKASTNTQPGKKSTETVENAHCNSDISRISSLPSAVLANHAQSQQSGGVFDQQPQSTSSFPEILPPVINPVMFTQPHGVPFPMLQNGPQAQEYAATLPNYAAYGGFPDHVPWLSNVNQALHAPNLGAAFIPNSGHPHSSFSGSSSEFSAYSNMSGGAPTSLNAFSSGSDSYCQVSAGQRLAGTQPFMGQVPFQRDSHGALQFKALHNAAEKHEALSSQLSCLDRYTAMHTWDLDPQSKKSLVEQRMHLVRELDTVRQYKEQLESVCEQLKVNGSDTQTEAASGTSLSSNQYMVTNFGGSQGSSSQQMFPTVNHAASIFTGPTLASTFPSALPVNGFINGPFPWQLPHMPMSMHPYSQMEVSCYEQPESVATAGYQIPVNPNDGKDPLDGDEWETPKRPAPPDVRKVYNKIEEATKRGDSIDGLLKELADATTRLVQRAQHERNERNVSFRSEPNCSGKSTPSGHNYGGADSISESSESNDGYAHSSRHAARRLWKSEGYSQKHSNNITNEPYDSDEEEDARSCSSYASTADSWATIEEGDKRWVEREMLRNNANGQDSVENGVENNAHTGMAKSQMPNVRDTLDWIQNTNIDGMKNVSPQLLIQYFNKDRGQTYQKSPALAVSQNVNAHAYVPSFDGAGGWSIWSDDSENQPVNEHSRNQTGKPLKQESGFWYMAKQRVKPSPAVLREFFHRVEEEERNMMYEYLMGSTRERG